MDGRRVFRFGVGYPECFDGKNLVEQTRECARQLITIPVSGEIQCGQLTIDVQELFVPEHMEKE